MKESIKITKLITALEKIIKATITENIKIISGNKWDYSISKGENILEIDSNSLLKTRWKYTLGKTFGLVAHNLFTIRPDNYVLRLKEDKFEHSFALSSLEELRVKRIMIFNYPGVRDLLRYNIELDNKKISKEFLDKLKPQRKLLWHIRNDFFGIKIKEIDIKILKTFKEYKKFSEELLGSENLDELINIFEKKMLKLYFSIYEKEEKSKNGDIEEEINEENKSTKIISEEDSSEINEELSKIIGEGKEDKNKYSNLVSYNDLYDEIYHIINSFSKKLNSKLKDNNYNRIGGNFRSGKLNTKKLYKIVTNDNKLFTRKLDRRHKDYMIGLLIDSSGSMQGDKIKLAIKSAILLSEVLVKVGIPFEIIGFNLDYREYKLINGKYDTKVKNRLITCTNDMRDSGGNNDGYAIRKISNSLIINSTPTTEKILIVLSDGKPAPYGQLNEEESKKFKLEKCSDFDLTKEIIRASKYMKVIGIGIQDDSVKQFYKHYEVLNNIELLPEIILNKLKNNIKRG